jgi:hypothetical protein
MHLSRYVPNPPLPLRALSFWAAVLLPVCYLPVVVGGFANAGEVGLFVGLVAAHAVALSLGHGHDP